MTEKPKPKVQTNSEEITKEVSAEVLFKEFKEVPLSEFFRKNRQYLGYVGKIKSLTTVVHEVVTNSLDACEEAGILPDIKITIENTGEENYKVRCEDNGPGIPETHLEMVFGQLLAGTKFHRNIQLRGQQGLGVSGAVLFSQITTGQPTRVKSGTGKGKVVDAKIDIDIKNNQPRIVSKEVVNDSFRGTIVESEFKGVQYTKGQRGPFEYIRWTAAANPHAQIYFKDPEGGEVLFERLVDKIPPKPHEIPPHPVGLEPHDILDLSHKSKARQIATFLSTELSRISSEKVKEIQTLVNFDLKISPKNITWQEAEQLVNAFKKIKFMAPQTDGLIPIGEKYITKALETMLAPDFVESITRAPAVYKGGIPFMIEAAIAYGGNAGRETPEGRKVELMRFANRAPLVFDAGACVMTDAMQSIDWKRYNLTDVENTPITVFVNMISTHVPYISAGKQSVADEDEVREEIRFALMQIARSLQKFLSGKRRASEREAKKKLFEKYIPETAKALAKLSGVAVKMLEEKLAKIVFAKFGKNFELSDEDREDIEYEEVAEEAEEGGEEE